MKKYIVLSVILCFVCLAQAQNYSSRKIAEMGELFPKICLPPTDSIFNCPQITKEKSFVVCYNSKQEIDHLGVSLFSPETKEMINLPVCNFIERMMLELLLQKSPTDVKSKLREYKIRLLKDGVEYGKSYNSTLDEIQTPTQFGIRKDSIFTAVWEFGNNHQFSMSFPASRELIFGTDKKESDLNLGDLLTNYDCQHIVENPTNISTSDFKIMEGSDLYRKRGEIFLINKINSDSYYQRSENLFQPVFNANYPLESLANLFITKQINNSLSLKITHKMYGGFTPEFIISLNKYICLFDNEFTTYCIMHRLEAGKIQLSVVFYNHDFNYIHLLRIKTTLEQLFSPNGILNADLYTNIPQHNLKSLF